MNARRLQPRTLLACLLLGLGTWWARADQEDFELPPIRYSKTAPNDAVTRPVFRRALPAIWGSRACPVIEGSSFSSHASSPR